MGEIEDAQDYTGVGRDIRLAREAAGQEIQDAAQTLRISVYHLEAIEAGRYSDLPSPVYVQGFVRSYAGHLQLDADEMVRRVRLELEPAIASDRLHFPVTAQVQAKPGRLLLLLALALALVVFGFWYLNFDVEIAPIPLAGAPPAELQADETASLPPEPRATGALQSPEPAPPDLASPSPLIEQAPETVSEAPQIPPIEELVGQTPPPALSSEDAGSGEVTDQGEQDGNEAILAEDVGAVEFSSGAAIAPATLSDNLAGIGAGLSPLPPGGLQRLPDPAVPILPETLADAPIVLRASADTWMRVSRANGGVVKSWVMRAGEQYVPPPGETGLVVMIGNAEALTIFVQGTALPSLGRKGDVIRGLPLDIAGLKAKFGG
ncbi:MAG: RodZ domain-containing protein [Alphaproteobacteria bacterium]